MPQISFQVEGIHDVVTGLNIVAEAIPRGGNQHITARMQEAIKRMKRLEVVREINNLVRIEDWPLN